MLRRLRGTIADPKYDGVPTSREQLFEESDGLDNEPDSEGVAVVESQFDASSKTDAQKGLYQIGNDEESESEPSHILQPPSKAEPMEDLSSTLRKTREEDLLKGRAVTRQIVRSSMTLRI
jgi:protein AATF/BFR2